MAQILATANPNTRLLSALENVWQAYTGLLSTENGGLVHIVDIVIIYENRYTMAKENLLESH